MFKFKLNVTNLIVDLWSKKKFDHMMNEVVTNCEGKPMMHGAD